MVRVRWNWLRIAAAAIALCGLAAAQVAYEFEPVVVTATRYPAGLLDINRFVTIIDSVQAVKYPGIIALLEETGCVDLTVRSDPVQADLTMRGASYQQVLVMVDGVRMNDPQTGHHNLDLNLPMSAVERIEILSGAAASLYGSDACAGVINIITKKRAGYSATVGAGSFDGRILAGRIGARRSYCDAEYQRNDGHHPGCEIRMVNAAGRVGFGLGAVSDNTFAFGYGDKAFGAKNFYAPYPSWERTRGFNGRLKSDVAIGRRLVISTVVFGRTHVDTFVLDRDDPDLYANRHQLYEYGTNLIANCRLPGSGILVSGFEALSDSLASTRLGQRGQRHFAGFLQTEHRFFGSRILLHAGVRDDYYSNRAFALNPALSIGYRAFPGLVLRTSAARAFRVPSFTELYYQDPANCGDSLLRPETAEEFEAGTDLRVPGVFGRMSFFYRRNHQNIDWVRRTGETVWQAANTGYSRFAGVDAAVDVGVAGPVLVRAAASGTNVSNYLAAGYESKYLMVSPRVTVAAGLTIFSKFEVNGRWQAFDRPGPGAAWRTIVNCRLQYPFTVRKAFRIRPFLSIDNLMNREYEDFAGVPLAGRSYRGCLEVSGSP